MNIKGETKARTTVYITHRKHSKAKKFFPKDNTNLSLLTEQKLDEYLAEKMGNPLKQIDELVEQSRELKEQRA